MTAVPMYSSMYDLGPVAKFRPDWAWGAPRAGPARRFKSARRIRLNTIRQKGSA